MRPEYHKIESVYKRDPDNHYKTFIMGDWSIPEFGYLADLTWMGTEKVDGTNCRIHIREDGYSIGGRTENSELHVDLMAALHDIGMIATHKGDFSGLTLYGEGYGAGIQKGGDYRPDKGFVLFDVMVTETGVFLEHENIIDIAVKLDIPDVPLMWKGTLKRAVNHFSDGRLVASDMKGETPMQGGVNEAEGWVLRPEVELRTRLGRRVITKIKVKDFPRGV